jgi:hypothetical protein
MGGQQSTQTTQYVQVSSNGITLYQGCDKAGWSKVLPEGEYDITKNPHWPEDFPDGYNENDINRINKDINELITSIYHDEKVSNLKPEFKSPNGYEISGADLSLGEKNIYFHEINRRTDIRLQAPFIGDIVKICKGEDNFENFTRII